MTEEQRNQELKKNTKGNGERDIARQLRFTLQAVPHSPPIWQRKNGRVLHDSSLPSRFLSTRIASKPFSSFLLHGQTWQKFLLLLPFPTPLVFFFCLQFPPISSSPSPPFSGDVDILQAADAGVPRPSSLRRRS